MDCSPWALEGKGIIVCTFSSERISLLCCMSFCEASFLELQVLGGILWVGGVVAVVMSL